MEIKINGLNIQCNDGDTVYEAAKNAGIFIPTLCHDERVEAYGACGICVVEMEGSPKLLRSCSAKVAPGMSLFTESERVIRSRQTALELLLSDHQGDCKAPCVRACPGETDCQGYVGLIANGKFREALKLIKEQLPLPASIGRVCPHPCESACRRKLVEEPINIAHLKYFVADLDLKDPFLPEKEPSQGKSMGIIGGGPGGLTMAYFMAVKGYDITIYDQMPQMGGMLRYGIPAYRLPKDILDEEIAIIRKLGVHFVNNCRIGKEIGFEEIRKRHDALYLAVGAWKSSSMRAKGEDMEGVMGGIDYLRKVALNEELPQAKRIAVVGGGNTAMDACRTAIRTGAEKVMLIYRRTEEEMPAEKIEIQEAREEGVEFIFLASPLKVLGKDGQAVALELQKMTLGEPDDSGRRRPVPVEGAVEQIETDLIIAAIGQKVDLKGLETVGTTPWETLQAEEDTYLTNLPGVFAGGDCINDGADIAIKAIGDAKRASEVADSYLKGNLKPWKKPFTVTRDEKITEQDFRDEPKKPRQRMPVRRAWERKKDFEEINLGYTEQQAVEEAKRCLECGCMDQFECKLFAYANLYPVKPEKVAGEEHRRQKRSAHPHIVHNVDKCILCGLCVRICSERMDNGALGLVDRGFDTLIQPAFGLPLEETDCISCGMCVNLCPTGALTEKLFLEKDIPLKGKKENGICTKCSLGCGIRSEFVGEDLIRILPDSKGINKGLLCGKGRFPETEEEIAYDKLSFQEKAFVSIGGDCSLEEMNAIGEKAKALGLPTAPGEKTFHKFPKEGEEIPWTEIHREEKILLCTKDIRTSHPIAALQLFEAKKKGAEIFLLEENTPASKWGKKIRSEDMNTLLQGDNPPLVIADTSFDRDWSKLFIPRYTLLYPSSNSRGLESHSTDLSFEEAAEKIRQRELTTRFVFGKSERLEGVKDIFIDKKTLEQKKASYINTFGLKQEQ